MAPTGLIRTQLTPWTFASAQVDSETASRVSHQHRCASANSSKHSQTFANSPKTRQSARGPAKESRRFEDCLPNFEVFCFQQRLLLSNAAVRSRVTDLWVITPGHPYSMPVAVFQCIGTRLRALTPPGFTDGGLHVNSSTSSCTACCRQVRAAGPFNQTSMQPVEASSCYLSNAPALSAWGLLRYLLLLCCRLPGKVQAPKCCLGKVLQS